MTIKLPKAPKIPYEGWKVHYHDGKTSFDPANLSLHLEPEQKESILNGNVLFERMKGEGLNSNVMDYLYEHQELIPEEWKDKYVYFWGTVFADADGDLCVRCFYWRGGVCGRVCDWLGGDWVFRHPAAVSASLKKSGPKLLNSKIYESPELLK